MAKKQPTQGIQKYIVRLDRYDGECVLCDSWKDVQRLIEGFTEDDPLDRVMDDLVIYELGVEVKVKYEQKITIERTSS